MWTDIRTLRAEWRRNLSATSIVNTAGLVALRRDRAVLRRTSMGVLALRRHQQASYTTLESAVLRDMIEWRLFSLCNDETRFYRDGVFFDRRR